MSTDPVLTAARRRFIGAARRAVLATIAPGGRPRLVPICFALEDDAPLLWTPLDQKAKASGDPLALARVRDILARPAVSILVDRWDEDWARLGWVRLRGDAALVHPGAPGHANAVGALRRRYPPYADHALETRPMIRVSVTRATDWGDLDP